ncbi:hypothetical protein Ddye_016840 [Dipteronia dyeriana]|uniref:MULE transposase domain-containing protein n=1 Tax=Dipteronia dyeriana TaxID=168575 RepID=A0AAD9WZY5_9ROSI|nr:hypothetical protein Ddye_016840 [Dipteronia dyeriana]
MNGRQYNHQYNEIYNDINNEQNIALNVRVNHEVDNEGNFNSIKIVEDNQDDEEPVETERRVRHVRHVHRFSSSAPDIAGTSEGRANVTPDDSDNATAWVIPGAELYSFGINGSRNLVEDEPTSMIYKGAVRRDEDTYFQEIHRRHQQSSAIIIGEVIAPRLQQQDGRLMLPKDIIPDMKSMYGIQIMYSKAHAALDCALSLTYGTHEETFQLLPSFGYVLEQQNPGTITNLQCNEDGKFMYFFMSIGASLRGFRTCMRPVIAVDGTHLKGQFRGSMFVATAQDGNDQVYPIAFGYCDSENNLSWEWFLDCLKGALGHIDELVFISDRHASIEAGIPKVFPYATYTIFYWHFAENIKKRFHRKVVAAIMDKAAHAYTEFE